MLSPCVSSTMPCQRTGERTCISAHSQSWYCMEGDSHLQATAVEISASARWTGGLCWIETVRLDTLDQLQTIFPCINSNEHYPCRRRVSVLTYLPRLLSRHFYKFSLLDKPRCQVCHFDKEHFSPLHFHTTDPLQHRQKCFSRFLVTAWKAFFFSYTSYTFPSFFYPTRFFSHCSYSGRFQFQYMPEWHLLTKRNQINMDTRYESATSNLCRWR